MIKILIFFLVVISCYASDPNGLAICDSFPYNNDASKQVVLALSKNLVLSSPKVTEDADQVLDVMKALRVARIYLKSKSKQSVGIMGGVALRIHPFKERVRLSPPIDSGEYLIGDCKWIFQEVAVSEIDFGRSRDSPQGWKVEKSGRYFFRVQLSGVNKTGRLVSTIEVFVFQDYSVIEPQLLLATAEEKKAASTQ
jgi:hypothetical protein